MEERRTADGRGFTQIEPAQLRELRLAARSELLQLLELLELLVLLFAIREARAPVFFPANAPPA